jgi:hypothetical protein
MSILDLQLIMALMAGLKITTPHNTTDRENRRYRLGTNQKLPYGICITSKCTVSAGGRGAPLEKILEDFQLSYQDLFTL